MQKNPLTHFNWLTIVESSMTHHLMKEVPNQVPIKMANDGSCCCSTAEDCPLDRWGLRRCSEEELNKQGYATQRLGGYYEF